MDCPSCGFANPDSHKFCSECGAPTGRPHHEAERRALTVMFCDLAGSTALSERLDPEDLQDVLTAYQDCCRAAIGRYGGFIARYMGDGILVYFGYPAAHEDDARRAVRAALDIVEAVPKLQTRPENPLAVRIGVATGDVVVGDIVGEGAAEERAVLGVTPNLAARLQSVAEENQIIVSDGTRQRLGDDFSTFDLGTFSLKGISEPSQAWRIDGLAKSSTGVGPSIPFVGRAHALERLESALNNTCSSRLETVHVVGLPGIGKTRLVTEFLSRHGDITPMVWPCSAFHGNAPLHPVPAELKVPTGTDSETGEAQRQAIFDAVVSHLAQAASSAPIILVVEDVHWIDPTTADLLETFHHKLAGLAVLVIVSGRPGEVMDRMADGMGGARLELGALDDAEAQELVTAMTGDRVRDAMRRDIIDRAGGLPLFLEELTRVVAEGGTSKVPVSLQESLLARLDGLGPAKRVAQLASVIGRSFTRADLTALSDATDTALGVALDSLLVAGLLVETGGTYAFRHALMHEVAYETLLRSTRRRIHGEIADHLMAEGDHADHEAPELVGRHLSGAGRHAEAAPYWCAAARRSAALWAHTEAAAYYHTALEHVTADTEQGWELALLLDLVDSLRILDRHEEALAQLDRAETLAHSIGTDMDWFRLHVLRGNILFPLGEVERCIASHEAALAVAQRMADPESEARALSVLADAQFSAGRMVTAEHAYDSCVAIAEAQGLNRVTLANLSLRGHMRVYLCRLEEAEADCRRAVDMALEAGNRRAEMTARGSCLGKVLLDAGEFSAANHAFSEAEQLAVDLGAPRYEAINLLFQGKVALDTGARADAMPLASRAVAIARDSGPRFCLPMAIGVVARAEESPEACRAALEEAEALIAEGCLAHNPLWFYRDAALAAVGHGWPNEARRYAQRLREIFAAEPIPWCDLIADGADALADYLETDTLITVEAAIEQARNLGFMGWARVLRDAAR